METTILWTVIGTGAVFLGVLLIVAILLGRAINAPRPSPRAGMDPPAD